MEASRPFLLAMCQVASKTRAEVSKITDDYRHFTTIHLQEDGKETRSVSTTRGQRRSIPGNIQLNLLA